MSKLASYQHFPPMGPDPMGLPLTFFAHGV